MKIRNIINKVHAVSINEKMVAVFKFGISESSIDTIYVDPKHRRKGIMTAIYEKLGISEPSDAVISSIVVDYWTKRGVTVSTEYVFPFDENSPVESVCRRIIATEKYDL